MKELRSGSRLGERLSVLANLMKLSQGKLAQTCKISRISVNRFFKGHSEIRASDFVSMLEQLGIDIESLIEQRIQVCLRDHDKDQPPLYKDVALVWSDLDNQAQKSLLEQMIWLGQTSRSRHSQHATLRLQSYLSQNAS